MPPLIPIKRTDLERGLITESAVSEKIYPEQALLESINFDFDTIGSATVRKGITIVGNQLSGNVLGLYQYIDSASTNSRLIMVNGNNAYYLSANTWISIRSGLTSNQSRFTTFLNFVWMVNGAESTAIWDGTTSGSFVTTGNASSAPIGKYIENFRSRVWIAGNSTYPDRLYYSSLPSAVTTPIVTWNTSVTTGTWIDIAPQDGESIIALKRSRTTLLVFKNNHIYRVYSINATEPDPSVNVGTYSSESVIEAKDGIYFHHPSGFYQYNDNGVSEISKPITDIVKNITVANYTKITGWLEPDGDHVCWSLGTVTYKNKTYTNLVVRYTISSQVWTHRTYPYQFLVSSRYNDGSTIFSIVGSNQGGVFETNTGNDDNNTPIFYSLVHHIDTIDGLESTEKNITNMLFSHIGGTGTNISYQKENDVTNDWTKILGQLKAQDTQITNQKINGRKFKFRVYGTLLGALFEYQGYEILEGNSDIIKIL